MDVRWSGMSVLGRVLQLNSIKPFVFTDATKDFLAHGRDKFRYVMIVDPANCGKTFLLKPLGIIFRAVINPANNKYAWVGADHTKVIVLQDFR